MTAACRSLDQNDFNHWQPEVCRWHPMLPMRWWQLAPTPINHMTLETQTICRYICTCMRAALILFVRPRGNPYTQNASPHLNEGSPHTRRNPSCHPMQSHIYVCKQKCVFGYLYKHTGIRQAPIPEVISTLVGMCEHPCAAQGPLLIHSVPWDACKITPQTKQKPISLKKWTHIP